VTYEEFADTRLAPLLRYAVMLTGDPHQAQDLVQETMVRVQLNWRRIARADSPERYVRRMLTNQYVDWRRGSWMRRVLLRGEPDEAVPAPVDHAQSAVDPGPDLVLAVPAAASAAGHAGAALSAVAAGSGSRPLASRSPCSARSESGCRSCAPIGRRKARRCPVNRLARSSGR
jgi:DNA-directed RNA polymerase specialized sigma24 family protein